MRRLALAALLALGLAGSAAAQSATQATSLPAPPAAKAADPAQPGAAAPRDAANKPAASGLRGSSSVLSPARPVTGVPEAPGIRRRAPDTALMSPGLTTPAAPRLTRDFEPVTGGGGQCRTKCAQELYFCQANEEGGGCDELWRKCVLACPSHSGSTP